MGRLDLPDRRRDEDDVALPISDASRAMNRGEYLEAIAILVNAGQDELDAERFVAVSLAINTPSVSDVPLRIAVLVEVARRAMKCDGWSFTAVTEAVERAQVEAQGHAA